MGHIVIKLLKSIRHPLYIQHVAIVRAKKCSKGWWIVFHENKHASNLTGVCSIFNRATTVYVMKLIPSNISLRHSAKTKLVKELCHTLICIKPLISHP